MGFADRLRTVVRDLPEGSRTIEKFSRALGAPRHTTVSAWLNGHSRPGSRFLGKIGEVTGVSVDWLLGFDVPKDRSEREQVGALRGALREHLVRLVEDEVRISAFVKGYTDYDDLVPPEQELLSEIEELFVGRAKQSARHLNKSFIRDLRRSLKAGLKKRNPHS